MAVHSNESYTANQDVRDAIATLIENLPDGEGLGFYTSRMESTEQSCLVVIAIRPKDIASVIERLSIAEKGI